VAGAVVAAERPREETTQGGRRAWGLTPQGTMSEDVKAQEDDHERGL